MSSRRKVLPEIQQGSPPSSDCTPVKRTERRNDTLAVSPLVTNLVDNDVKDMSPDLQYSPLIKPLQSDIEWAWKSPIGRLPNAGTSGAVTKRRLLNLNKTPLQPAKRRSKSNSPLTNPPLKRKLIKVEKKEDDNLSSLTSEWQALTERKNVPSEKVEGKEIIKEDYRVEHTISTSENAARCEANVDSFSALLDDDEDCFALLCCSQVMEAKLTENPSKVVFSPIIVKTSTISPPHRIQTSTPMPNKTSSIFNQEQNCPNRASDIAAVTKSQKIIANLGSDIVKLPNTLNNNLPGSLSSSFTPEVRVLRPSNAETVLHGSKLNTTAPKLQQKSNQTAANHKSIIKLDSNFESTIKDDSFDNALLSICDENIDQQCFAAMGGSTAVVPTTTISATTKNIHSSEIQCKPPNSSTIKQRDSVTITGETMQPAAKPSTPVLSNDVEEDFIQPDLLNLLEKIEFSSVRRDPSPPLQCTPEEIEKKRRLAKVKLEQKKIALLQGINRLPNPLRRSK